MTDADIHGGGYPPVPRPRAPRVRFGTVLLGLLALVFAVALGTSAVVIAGELTRAPTAAERSGAASTELAQRWAEWSTGRVFPAVLSYRLALGGKETATLVGIDPATSCAHALESTAAATRDGCRVVLRATYLGQTQGAAATVGVVVLPTPDAARAFWSTLPSGAAAGLHALALPGTVAALFTDPARLTGTNLQAGPYVAIAVAGYADGRPATATTGGSGVQKGEMTAMATSLVADVLGALGAPATPACTAPEFRC